MDSPTICSQRSLDNLPPLWDISPLVVIEMDLTNEAHRTAWLNIIHKSFPPKGDSNWLPDIGTSIVWNPICDVRHTYFLMNGDQYIGVISEAVFRLNLFMGVPHYLGLDPAYQNKGLGKYLLLYSMHRMKAHGLHQCEGESTMEHQTALLIHFALGMTPKLTRDNWNTPGEVSEDYPALYDAWRKKKQARIGTNSEWYIGQHHYLPLSHPANNPHALENLTEVLKTRRMAGGGLYTKQCQHWFETTFKCPRALLTPSGTAALELSALLSTIKPGDEVIMPSYTYPTTASAFVLRGAVPVFVDIRPDTLNIDEQLIEAAITPRTKAIVPVHYGGVICNMLAIRDIADASGRDITIIEDAAQALGSDWGSQPYGDMTMFSFHDTKNIVCGEGGALLIHDPSLVDQADILWWSGTDQHQFREGQVDHYTWQDIGSSFPPSEFQAAVLSSQLGNLENWATQRQHIWQMYHTAFADRDTHQRPTTGHNAHMYYLLVPADDRARILDKLHRWGVGAAFHFVPLHSSPAGVRYGRVSGTMTWTDLLSQQIIRLPLYVGDEGMTDEQVFDVIRNVKAAQ